MKYIHITSKDMFRISALPYQNIVLRDEFLEIIYIK